MNEEEDPEASPEKDPEALQSRQGPASGRRPTEGSSERAPWRRGDESARNLEAVLRTPLRARATRPAAPQDVAEEAGSGYAAPEAAASSAGRERSPRRRSAREGGDRSPQAPPPPPPRSRAQRGATCGPAAGASHKSASGASGKHLPRQERTTVSAGPALGPRTPLRRTLRRTPSPSARPETRGAFQEPKKEHTRRSAAPQPEARPAARGDVVKPKEEPKEEPTEVPKQELKEELQQEAPQQERVAGALPAALTESNAGMNDLLEHLLNETHEGLDGLLSHPGLRREHLLRITRRVEKAAQGRCWDLSSGR